METPRTDAIALKGTEIRTLAGQLADLARELESENGKLRTTLGDLVDAVNVEFPSGMRDIGGKTGIALIQAVNALAVKPDVAAIIAAQKNTHKTDLKLD